MGNTIGEFFNSILGIQPSTPQGGGSKTTSQAAHPVDRFTAMKDQIAVFGEKYTSTYRPLGSSILDRTVPQLCSEAERDLGLCEEYFSSPSDQIFETHLHDACYSELSHA